MFKITFLGDIMCDNKMAEELEKYYDKAQNQYRFDSMFEHIAGLLSKSDYVLANLETPISYDNSGLTVKQWEFCSPYKFAEAVRKCGVDFVSTANNHCLDRGIKGLESTINSLNKIGFDHCGIHESDTGKNYVIVTSEGAKLGILSYTYGTNAFSNRQYLPFTQKNRVNLLQEQEGRAEQLWIHVFRGHFRRIFKKLSQLLYPQNIGKQIYERETLHLYRRLMIYHDLRKLKREKPDYTIAYLHIGGQYNICPSAYTKSVSQWFARHGCDAVICNHEHVVHSMVLSNGKLVAYALGNCIGSAGILEPPYDRRSEYSIALHVYLSEGDHRVCCVSFSVLKTVKDSVGKLSVWPAFDLLHQTNGERADKLEQDILTVAKDFSGIPYNSVCQEFTIVKT